MHPRIKEITPEKALNLEVLHLLKNYGATRTYTLVSSYVVIHPV
jgi:hypothetical protein